MLVAGLVCVLLAAVSADSDITVYKKVGDEVVLQPGADPLTSAITNVIWKDGVNIAVEWEGPGTDILYNRHFSERSMLNITSGELRITGLTQGDSGLFTLEVNNNNVPTATRLIVISPVPTPAVVKSCEDEIRCVLTCEGNTTGAEPVTYAWSGDGAPIGSSKELQLTKTDRSRQFSCELQNPVSQERSPPVLNPLASPAESDPEPWTPKVSNGVIVLISLLALVLVLVFVHRWKAGAWFFKKDSMPWSADFWRKKEKKRGRDETEANGTQQLNEAEV